jgi:hypothetical protein
LCAGCGGGDSDADKADADSPPSSAAASDSASAEPGEVSAEPAEGDPATDPCELFTQEMAEAALDAPVGPATKQPGEGNVTCYYTPADGSANVFALLTTYVGSGEDALATATAEFPDARPVQGLGDAAFVSRQGHAIGVAVDDLLFAMSLLKADAFTGDPAVAEAELIEAAHVVVDSR